MKAVMISDFVLIGLLSFGIASGQVCSPPGQLCTRTTDCCKGCCEAHTCIDRPFSCSGDLIKQPGFGSCIGYFCPPGQLCYLRDVCPPENPCPRLPSCRRIDQRYNYTDGTYRNSNQRTQAGPAHVYFAIAILIGGFVCNAIF